MVPRPVPEVPDLARSQDAAAGRRGQVGQGADSGPDAGEVSDASVATGMNEVTKYHISKYQITIDSNKTLQHKITRNI